MMFAIQWVTSKDAFKHAMPLLRYNWVRTNFKRTQTPKIENDCPIMRFPESTVDKEMKRSQDMNYSNFIQIMADMMKKYAAYILD